MGVHNTITQIQKVILYSKIGLKRPQDFWYTKINPSQKYLLNANFLSSRILKTEQINKTTHGDQSINPTLTNLICMIHAKYKVHDQEIMDIIHSL